MTCNGTSGKWVQDQHADGDSDDYIGDDGVLGPFGDMPILEHLCLGGEASPPLVINVTTLGDGSELVCERDFENDGAVITVTAPNKCLLLCDFSLALSFESEFSANGDYEFVDNDKDPIEGGMVKCWD